MRYIIRRKNRKMTVNIMCKNTLKFFNLFKVSGAQGRDKGKGGNSDRAGNSGHKDDIYMLAIHTLLNKKRNLM